MAGSEQKRFDTPDEVREFPHGRAEIVNIGGGEVGRLVLEPGWRWSEHVKPIAGTELCQAPHFQYIVSGRVGVRMADGTEMEVGPGGRQIQLEDPDGNPIELFEPAGSR